MGKILVVSIIVIVLVIGIFYFVFSGGEIEDVGEGGGKPAVLIDVVDNPTSAAPVPGNEEDETIVVKDNENVEEPVTHKITITESGYSPSNLEINAGDTVTWVNEGVRSNWPATDLHPSHTVYPGSSRTLCGSASEDEIFDACKGLEQGERYSFIFTEEGTWRYHDHLRASMKGTIIVN